MRHVEVEPVHAGAVRLTQPDGGFPYRTLGRRPLGPTSHEVRTSLLYWPDGGSRPWGQADQLEYHTLHEEIFVLTGSIRFDHWYTVQAPGYLNHPPFWVHPTNFSAVGELLMLMRTSIPPVVQFEQVPDAWNGREYFASGQPTRCSGVTRLQVNELAWAPLRHNGAPTGVEAKLLWEDADDGWITWLMRVPAGWVLSAPREQQSGGDEFFVIEGDLDVDFHGTAAHLGRHGYCCSADELAWGGTNWGSTSGATFVRWTNAPPAFLTLDRLVSPRDGS